MVTENPSQMSKWSLLRDIFKKDMTFCWCRLCSLAWATSSWSIATWSADDDVFTSLTDILDDITAETPLTVTDGEAVTPKQTPSSPDSTGMVNGEMVNPNRLHRQLVPKYSPGRVSGSSTERQATVSKYLVSPTTDILSGAGHKSLPHARLLTTAESLSALAHFA